VRGARGNLRPYRDQKLLVSGNRESSVSTARSEAAGPRQEGEDLHKRKSRSHRLRAKLGEVKEGLQ
jgi:hypothetical protein